MLFVDKHVPKELGKMDYHKNLSNRLINLAQCDEFPHLLIHGPLGAGKKTRVMALLRELFGAGACKVRLEHKTFQPEGCSQKIEITTVASNYHIEINPSDAGIRDRFVVQEVIKEIASYHLADKKAKKNFKIVVLTEVNRLSKPAQHALRRTMEKYTSSCRLILCCSSTSKVIDPIQSRCVTLRVGAPTEAEVVSVLEVVCKKEGIRFNEPLGIRIAQASGRNLRRAILMLETCFVQNRNLQADQPVLLPGWEEYTSEVVKVMLQEQSPAGILKVRAQLYNLLTNCIPAELIIKTICKLLMTRLDDDIKGQVIHWAAYYEHQLNCGSKDIFHLEAFVAKFMTIYKSFLLDMYG